MNVKFTIQYDGTAFLGSQTQPNGLSVEDKLYEVFKSLNINTKIISSGRTDKDVHATGQVFNCEIPNYWKDLEKLKSVLNRKIGLSIKIKHICIVQDSFHARFWAKRRTYRYILSKKQTSPFSSKYLAYCEKIDKKKILKAIALFVGKHDFEYFHKKGSDKENTVREIYEAKFYETKDLYVFKFCANSYLRSQIRLMVGILLKISENKISIEDLQAQLDMKKQIFKTPASPYGLYLTKVEY